MLHLVEKNMKIYLQKIKHAKFALILNKLMYKYQMKVIPFFFIIN